MDNFVQPHLGKSGFRAKNKTLFRGHLLLGLAVWLDLFRVSLMIGNVGEHCSVDIFEWLMVTKPPMLQPP